MYEVVTLQSTEVMGNWPMALENSLATVENLQIHHSGRFA